MISALGLGITACKPDPAESAGNGGDGKTCSRSSLAPARTDRSNGRRHRRGPVGPGGLRRRVLLVHRGGLRTARRRHRRDQRLRRRRPVHRQLKAVTTGRTGHAEGDPHHLRSDDDHLRPTAQGLLRHPRPDHAQPPGRRRRHPVPLRAIFYAGDAQLASAGRTSNSSTTPARSTRPSSPSSRSSTGSSTPRNTTRTTPGRTRSPATSAPCPPKVKKVRDKVRRPGQARHR
jgi:hypothetical protein